MEGKQIAAAQFADMQRLGLDFNFMHIDPRLNEEYFLYKNWNGVVCFEGA